MMKHQARMNLDGNADQRNADLALVKSCKRGALEQIPKHLANGASIYAATSNKLPLPHWAALKGDIKLIQALVKNGLDVNDDRAKTANKKTALHTAAENGQTRACSMLIDLGADIEAQCINKKRPLHECASRSTPGQFETALLLLQKGAQVDPVDWLGDTAALTSAKLGHPEMLALFLRHGCDPDAKNQWKISVRSIIEKGKSDNIGAVTAVLASHDAMKSIESVMDQSMSSGILRP